MSRVLVAAQAEGEVLVLDEALSFWGGLDVASGEINDVHHPQFGASVTDKVVVLPFARGSSSTANALAESIHRGTGPAGIVLQVTDEIVVLGATVPGELYDEWRPVIVADRSTYASFVTGQRVRIERDGEVATLS